MTVENKPKYTVEQLIEALKKFPPNMPVITDGYEIEYENIEMPQEITVKFSPDEPYYNGQFHETKQKSDEAFKAVVLKRECRF